MNTKYYITINALVAQWLRAFVSQAVDWVFESRPRQTLIVKIGCNNSTAKRSAIEGNVTGPRKDHYKRMPRVTVDVTR